MAMAAAGLTTLSSAFGAKETADRLEAEINAAGLTVVARIDHAGAAASVGLPLRPTELLIFGNAKAGTESSKSSADNDARAPSLITISLHQRALSPAL